MRHQSSSNPPCSPQPHKPKELTNATPMCLNFYKWTITNGLQECIKRTAKSQQNSKFGIPCFSYHWRLLGFFPSITPKECLKSIHPDHFGPSDSSCKVTFLLHMTHQILVEGDISFFSPSFTEWAPGSTVLIILQGSGTRWQTFNFFRTCMFPPCCK